MVTMPRKVLDNCFLSLAILCRCCIQIQAVSYTSKSDLAAKISLGSNAVIGHCDWDRHSV